MRTVIVLCKTLRDRRFGDSYTLEQIKSRIGDDGIYLGAKDSIDFSSITWKGYTFQNVTYGDRLYPSMIVLTLNSNIFGGLLFAFDKNIPAWLVDAFCSEKTF